ncbi:ABC transporter ATP-binding protein [Niallia taxi]|uniref:ABC transporter ATP-binding protein n=1 Tax=Niallia taxi TaxID=2499688 RepID=UPI0039829E4D
MRNLLLFLRKLVKMTGYRIYINFIFSILISALEGIGIYLLVPLLAVAGVFELQVDNVFPISYLIGGIEQLPFQINLSFVLILYFLLLAGQALLQRSQSIMNTWIQQNFIKKLRLEIYSSLIRAKWEFFISKRSSDFNYILTTEIGRIGSGIHSIIQFLSILFFTFVQILLAILLSPLLTIIVLLSGLMLAYSMKRSLKKSKRLGKETTDIMNGYFGGITEQFNGIKDMKSNMLESPYESWFQSKSNKIQSNIMQLVRLSSTSTLIYRIVAALLIVIIVYASFNLLSIAPEKLVIVILIFSRLWPRFTSIQNNLEQIIAMLPAIDNILRVQKESYERQELLELSQRNGNRTYLSKAIECRNLGFRYDRTKDNWALSNIDLQIPINETTAIVGQSGAGKSTLVDILMGLLTPEIGEITVNNKELSGENLLSYRSCISYVSQEPFLFHASIRDNLTMVELNASDDDIWMALSFAAADKFVRSLPEGIDTIIGDRGIKLSGGERQRIVLARAILRKPSILVLDEATSALDSETEQKIQESIDRLKGKMTIIIIAHRLSTIRNADKVVVLKGGMVIQQGSYQELSHSQGAFLNMLKTQELAGTHSIA